MRILYHHRTASKDGQAVHIDELIGALRALGHEVRVVGPAGGGAMADDVSWVHKLKATLPKAIYELLELGYTLVAYRKLAAVAREWRPDFVYERYNLFLLAGALLKRRFGIPLLQEVNAPLAEERARFGGLGLPRIARWAENAAWRSADFVLPVTMVLANYVAAAGVPPARVVVIANGINRDHFAGAPSVTDAKAALGLEGALVLGFTGFVRDWHGVDRVVRWMGTDQAPQNAVLMVVGDGPARADLEQLATRLGLGDRVRFTGTINRSRVPEHVAAFDVALQPAVVPYASPLKLFEYLALGKPVIAPRLPNIQEVLCDGVNAVLFEAEAAGAFEGALTRLCADADLRAALSIQAMKTIDRLDLTWLGNARRVSELAEKAARIAQHSDRADAAVRS